ncbi:all trans-polyprenyl-diphosphate synthase PDSS1-like [Haliotis cracherodii]|uniref:all trans-polyprenyl-diphosphate synthase PDSS1-like n=1 Tax=Haliotis cracherodii TaxID=6455 RepID=UPI0039E8CE53
MAAVRSRLHKSLLRICGHFRHKQGNISVTGASYHFDSFLGRRQVIFHISKNQYHVLQRHQHPCCTAHVQGSPLGHKTGLHLTRPSSNSPQHDNTVYNPYKLVEEELGSLSQDIKKEIVTDSSELAEIAGYYFDGKGKAFRPMIVLLMARACNIHNDAGNCVLPAQKKIAMITEMIHTASLVHDDVIDAADTRRNKSSINLVWGQKKAILAGDYILSIASMALARLRNEQVVSILSQVIEDLVRGEFMQLGSKEEENERFAHYLKKTFKKTASLLANSCKAVAVLGRCTEDVTEIAYQYGRNIGIAFQLIDDLLDFVSCDQVMGKPTAADLKLGLATAPVLFASQSYPELNAMIMRRFSHDGDVERAREMVAKSDGVEQTRLLAKQHSLEAMRQLRRLAKSEIQSSLSHIAEILLKRTK